LKILSDKGKTTLPGLLQEVLHELEVKDVLVGSLSTDYPKDIVQMSHPDDDTHLYLEHAKARLAGKPSTGELKALLEGVRHSGEQGLIDNIKGRLR
tara:strand:- start:604 stop:891 length:288 start_codon:yes stop_codon:yes gene_type:complete